jgi:hypothetical protein
MIISGSGMKLHDPAAYRWRTRYPWLWSAARSTWEEQRGGSSLPGMHLPSMFDPYMGEGTIWQRDVSSMPLHAQSATMAAWMWSETPTRFASCAGAASGAFGSKTGFNTSSFGTHPIPACIVDSTEPGCRFQYMDSVAGPNMTTAEVDALLKGPLPWPTGFAPAHMGDRGLALYDLGTGILREYFGVLPVTDKPGHWTAATGGFSLAKPWLEDFVETNYATQLQAGSSAVVLMHNSLGFVGIDEVRRGHIGHALAFTMANATCGKPASWPGVWSDGKFPNASWSGWAENGGANGPYPGDSPRHGQWGRLPASVDPDFNPSTGLPYNPLTRLLIEAAKTYGLCGTDTNAFVHAFNGESGNREKALYGVDPWAASGELAQILNPSDPSTAFVVSDFPWNLTQWAPFDWGRPNPDFRLRPGENSYYEPHGVGDI